MLETRASYWEGTVGFSIDPTWSISHNLSIVAGSRKAAAALIDLQHQLTARQIELLVVPVPVKPSIYPEKLSSRFDPQASPLPDPTLEALFGMLSSAEVPYLDLARLLAQLKSSQPAYLATDTHWTPAGVEQAVEGIHTWIHRHRP